MGACLSSGRATVDHLNDSVHVMLALDRKRRNESGTGGAAPAGYKPRSSNPLLETTVGGDMELGKERREGSRRGAYDGYFVCALDLGNMICRAIWSTPRPAPSSFPSTPLFVIGHEVINFRGLVG